VSVPQRTLEMARLRSGKRKRSPLTETKSAHGRKLNLHKKRRLSLVEKERTPIANHNSSDICAICKVWGSLPDSSCDCCPLSYHDRCLPKIHRHKQYTQCSDIGYECDHKTPPIHFRFGPLLYDVNGSSDTEPDSSKFHDDSSNEKQHRSCSPSSQRYSSFIYNGVEYAVGDDIVITMPKDEGSWGVARITKIYHDELADDIPLLRLLWFWRATELKGTSSDDMASFDRGGKEDLEYHEIHLDERCPGDIYVDELIESRSTSKALVVPTEKEYAERVADGSYKLDFYDVFWCTHTFNHKSGKLCKISAARLRSIVTTPSSKKSRKRKQAAPKHQDHDSNISEQMARAAISPTASKKPVGSRTLKPHSNPMFKGLSSDDGDDDDLSIKSPVALPLPLFVAAQSSKQSAFHHSHSAVRLPPNSHSLSISISSSPSVPPPAIDSEAVLKLPSLSVFNEYDVYRPKALQIDVVDTGSHRSDNQYLREIADLKRELGLERSRREFWRKKYDEADGLKKSVLHLQYALDRERKQRIALQQQGEFERSLRVRMPPSAAPPPSDPELGRFKEIASRLYSECVEGEGPRWHSVAVETQNRIVRDQELADLRTAITSLYPSGSLTVRGIGKWGGNKSITDAVETFIIQNGEYSTDSMTYLKSGSSDSDVAEEVHLSAVIEKFEISEHPRIPVLNGQFGIRARRDIPCSTCLGQYIGGELLQDAFDKIFDGAGNEYDHNLYSFDQEIDRKELCRVSCRDKAEPTKKRRKQRRKAPPRKIFIIDPFIGEWAEDELILRYVNDCRADINTPRPTAEDGEFYNVEFAGLNVNGWPQTFLVTKRDIKRGEELCTYYGPEFSTAIAMKCEADRQRRRKKERIDRQILGGVPLTVRNDGGGAFGRTVKPANAPTIVL